MPFSGFQDLNPNFASALQQLIAQVPGVTPFSGYRTIQHQQELWQKALQKYGSAEAARKWVAPPGHSQHNMRMAVDLRFANPAARQAAHNAAAGLGLAFPLGNEPWHIELAGARGGKGGAASDNTLVAVGDAAPPDPTREPSLADNFSRQVLARGGGGNIVNTDTQQVGLSGHTAGDIAPLDFPSAVPQAASLAPPAGGELSPLAQLFQLKNIGQAPALQQQAQASLIRPFYG